MHVRLGELQAHALILRVASDNSQDQASAEVPGAHHTHLAGLTDTCRPAMLPQAQPQACASPPAHDSIRGASGSAAAAPSSSQAPTLPELRVLLGAEEELPAAHAVIQFARGGWSWAA